MKKTIKYTEQDIERLVGKIIKEDSVNEARWKNNKSNKLGKPWPKMRKVTVDGSIFIASTTDDKTYYIHKEDEGVTKAIRHQIYTSPNGSLILTSDLINHEGPTLDKKRIKVPSVEKALLYLTKLQKEVDTKKDAELDRYDDMIEQHVDEAYTLPRRERERHATQFAKSSFEPYDREREIMNVFGPYRDDVPTNVISYLRKNPRNFLRRLTAVYGMEKMLEYIGYDQNLDQDPNIT